MAHATHQTVRLVKGRHSTPEDGACALELASMLAGERFSDRPACVDPVIGGFLRAYDDGLDGEARRGLFGLAADAVGTRAGRTVERERSARCLERAADWGAVASAGRWARHRRRCERAGAVAAAAALALPAQEREECVDGLLAELRAIGSERPRAATHEGELTLDGGQPAAD